MSYTGEGFTQTTSVFRSDYVGGSSAWQCGVKCQQAAANTGWGLNRGGGANLVSMEEINFCHVAELQIFFVYLKGAGSECPPLVPLLVQEQIQDPPLLLQNIDPFVLGSQVGMSQGFNRCKYFLIFAKKSGGGATSPRKQYQIPAKRRCISHPPSCGFRICWSPLLWIKPHSGQVPGHPTGSNTFLTKTRLGTSPTFPDPLPLRLFGLVHSQDQVPLLFLTLDPRAQGREFH